jgi:hypothetical protein
MAMHPYMSSYSYASYAKDYTTTHKRPLPVKTCEKGENRLVIHGQSKNYTAPNSQNSLCKLLIQNRLYEPQPDFAAIELSSKYGTLLRQKHNHFPTLNPLAHWSYEDLYAVCTQNEQIK